MINYVIYESLKKAYINDNDSYNISASTLFIIGAISKSIATIITYPILTIRVNLVASKSTGNNKLFFILKIVKQLGIRGLYLGIFAKFTHTIFYNAMLMVIYEKIRFGLRILFSIYIDSTFIWIN